MAAVGSIDITYEEIKTIKKVILDWTSSSDTGAVSGVLTKPLAGIIDRVTFVPDSGDTQPSNQYDVTLEDEEGIDVLGGQGADLSNAAASSTVGGVPLKDGTTTTTVPFAISGTLELKVAAAGNSNGGQVILYLR